MARRLVLPLLTALACLISLPCHVRGDSFDDLWNNYIQAQQSQQTAKSSSESNIARRDRNLDHWDVPTAAAHLGLHPTTLKPLPRHSPPTASDEVATTVDEYIGHDAAILFYVQRSNDCHAVAPSWDAIASHVKAGSTSSNLVMALFDCERNTRHGELCAAVGVKSYPTIMYVGSGEYNGAEHGILGIGSSKNVPRRSIKFRGDWRYADQILDWISVMGGLSSWHAANEGGPLRGLRDGLFRIMGGGGGGGGTRSRDRRNTKRKSGGGESLPVGVPTNFQAELRGGGRTVSAAEADKAQQKVQDLEKKLNATIKEKGLYEKANLHSGYLLDGLLFPRMEGDSTVNRRDPFTILTKSDGWYRNATSLPTDKDGKIVTPNDEHPTILRSCALELIVDYCTRVTSRATNAYIKELNAIPESDPFPTLDEIETRLLDDVRKIEPYCGTIESCVRNNFESSTNSSTISTMPTTSIIESDESSTLLTCRPPKCPFVNDAACTYIECCLEPNVQDEYGVALGLIDEGERVLDKDWSNNNVGKGKGRSKDEVLEGKVPASVGGWGVPAK